VLELPIYIKAILLGIIEGLTEFIPISSTAHLVIFSQILNFDSIRNNVFEIAIQIGGISAIAVIYFKKLNNILLKFYEKNNQKFVDNLALAFVPAVAIGLISHDFIKKYLFSNFVIAFSLIFGGIVIILVEKFHKKIVVKNIEEIQKPTALVIGFFQCLAMIPGVSRSGATIMGAMLFGVERKVATEFSFFLAIPTIGSACLYDIYKNFSTLTFNDFELILVGVISSFISSLIVIKWLLKFIANHSFIGFGYYRIISGFLILFLSLKT
jgi:undecaprenyl-diphosphatase